MEFREFLENHEFVEFVINEFDANPVQAKPWSAKKAEILQLWRNLRSDTPIYMTPIAKTGIIGKKSYGEDGIRITGSWNFIVSILGRIKDILNYESPNTKLRLIFRGVDRLHGDASKNSFVFYVNSEPRSSKI